MLGIIDTLISWKRLGSLIFNNLIELWHKLGICRYQIHSTRIIKFALPALGLYQYYILLRKFSKKNSIDTETHTSPILKCVLNDETLVGRQSRKWSGWPTRVFPRYRKLEANSCLHSDSQVCQPRSLPELLKMLRRLPTISTAYWEIELSLLCDWTSL